MAKGTESLIGIVMIEGKMYRECIHEDGSHGYKELDETSATEKVETKTIPQDWTDPKTDALIMSEKVSRDKHVERSCQFEAMMIKYLDGNTVTRDIDTKGNKVCKQILVEFCGILGWEDKIKNIK